jgi:hypothetical protein
MKFASIALIVAMAFSAAAQAEVVQQPDINPDTLAELFMTSTLVQCDANACWDAVTNVDHEIIMDGAGYAVVYSDPALARLKLTVDEFDRYKPYVLSLMIGVAAELGAPVQKDI